MVGKTFSQRNILVRFSACMVAVFQVWYEIATHGGSLFKLRRPRSLPPSCLPYVSHLICSYVAAAGNFDGVPGKLKYSFCAYRELKRFPNPAFVSVSTLHCRQTSPHVQVWNDSSVIGRTCLCCC